MIFPIQLGALSLALLLAVNYYNAHYSYEAANKKYAKSAERSKVASTAAGIQTPSTDNSIPVAIRNIEPIAVTEKTNPDITDTEDTVTAAAPETSETPGTSLANDETRSNTNKSNYVELVSNRNATVKAYTYAAIEPMALSTPIYGPTFVIPDEQKTPSDTLDKINPVDPMTAESTTLSEEEIEEEIFEKESELAAAALKAEILRETKRLEAQTLAAKQSSSRILLETSTISQAIQNISNAPAADELTAPDPTPEPSLDRSLDRSGQTDISPSIQLAALSTAEPKLATTTRTTSQIQDHKWFSDLPPNQFVVQVAASISYQELVEYVRDTKFTGPVAIYPFKANKNGNLLYGLSTGLYDSREAAVEGLEQIPISEEHGVWVRKVSIVAREIEALN